MGRLDCEHDRVHQIADDVPLMFCPDCFRVWPIDEVDINVED